MDTNVGFDLRDLRTIFPPVNILNYFFMLPNCENEVLSVISMLNSNKSPGIDRMSAHIIKFSGNYICSILSHIINLSFSTGEFPHCLKTVVVIRLFKKGQEVDLNNYRPISLLSNFPKIIEKIVKSRIMKFLTLNNVSSSKQFGFLEKRSPV